MCALSLWKRASLTIVRQSKSPRSPLFFFFRPTRCTGLPQENHNRELVAAAYPQPDERSELAFIGHVCFCPPVVTRGLCLSEGAPAEDVGGERILCPCSPLLQKASSTKAFQSAPTRESPSCLRSLRSSYKVTRSNPSRGTERKGWSVAHGSSPCCQRYSSLGRGQQRLSPWPAPG